MEWIDEEPEEPEGAEESESSDQLRFACPYCWEAVEPPLEADIEGELVWDCEVCCRPWLIRVRFDAEGTRHVTVERNQD